MFQKQDLDFSMCFDPRWLKTELNRSRKPRGRQCKCFSCESWVLRVWPWNSFLPAAQRGPAAVHEGRRGGAAALQLERRPGGFPPSACRRGALASAAAAGTSTRRWLTAVTWPLMSSRSLSVCPPRCSSLNIFFYLSKKKKKGFELF